MPPGGHGVGVGTHMHNELLCLARAHMPWSLLHPGVVGGWGLRNNRVLKKRRRRKIVPCSVCRVEGIGRFWVDRECGSSGTKNWGR